MPAVLPLYDYQMEAIKKMKNGCILRGGVGSGKSRTALAYYYIQQDGVIGTENCVPMGDPPKDLYIITTARKRDTLEWEGEMVPFLLSTKKENNLYSNKVVVDSWNNIQKYSDVKDSFFIFDEQRVVGYGSWVKAFLSIAKKNEWILLSATPGDTWHDYIPVFIANGFYKNKTEFEREHAVYSRLSKFPKVERYINTGKLIRLRNSILVDMEFERNTVPHHEDVVCDYDILGYKELIRKRWNLEKGKPIENASEFCFCLRKLVNTDTSRQIKLMGILERHNKAIIFYNFDYELEILRKLCADSGLTVAEWNGHVHQPVPSGHYWAYLVQYTAGAEGWNCITTDTIIFYSQNYSYKITTQAAGRIDRLNTPYTDLYYYHLKSKSSIDLAISRSLAAKKDFNSGGFAGKYNFNQSKGE
jgi:hypothetical protein